MANFFNNYFFIFLAILVGVMGTMQAVINVKLTNFIEHPILSAFLSFVIGTLALLIYILAAGIPLGNLLNARQAPFYVWTAGLLGAFFVFAVIILVPRLGVALTFSLIVGGQMFISLILDHLGWFGVTVREISLMRVVGATLITIGVVLIRKY